MYGKATVLVLYVIILIELISGQMYRDYPDLETQEHYSKRAPMRFGKRLDYLWPGVPIQTLTNYDEEADLGYVDKRAPMRFGKRAPMRFGKRGQHHVFTRVVKDQGLGDV